MLVLTVAAASTARAQSAWQQEIGVQGGYSRFVAAGSGGQHSDVFGLPGFNLGPAAPFTPALFAVLPWKKKIGIEIGVSATQLTGTTSATLVEADLRGNYALTPQFYVGAGGGVGFLNNNGTSETQLGLQAAVGYRRHLTGPLMGRIEIRTMFWGNTENVGPTDLYSVLFGVSTRTHGGPASPSRPSRNGNNRAWTPQLGLSAGYANMHPIGGGADVTSLTFPTFGGALGAYGSPQYSVLPTLYAILPIANKFAIEPGIDVNRLQGSGSTTFAGTVSARLNYALHKRWYAGLGGSLNYLKSGSQSATRTGLNTAVGYRFPFTRALGGRIELNYSMFQKNSDLGIAPVNVVGLMFGASVPLK